MNYKALRYLIVALLFSLEALAQAPLRSDIENTEVFAYNTSNDHRTEIYLGLDYFSKLEQVKKRKGKWLIISGLAAATVGIIGISSAWRFEGDIIPTSMYFSGISVGTGVVLVSSIPLFAGLGMTTWGTLKYIKSK